MTTPITWLGHLQLSRYVHDCSGRSKWNLSAWFQSGSLSQIVSDHLALGSFFIQLLQLLEDANQVFTDLNCFSIFTISIINMSVKAVVFNTAMVATGMCLYIPYMCITDFSLSVYTLTVHVSACTTFSPNTSLI